MSQLLSIRIYQLTFHLASSSHVIFLLKTLNLGCKFAFLPHYY